MTRAGAPASLAAAALALAAALAAAPVGARVRPVGVGGMGPRRHAAARSTPPAGRRGSRCRSSRRRCSRSPARPRPRCGCSSRARAGCSRSRARRRSAGRLAGPVAAVGRRRRDRAQRLVVLQHRAGELGGPARRGGAVGGRGAPRRPHARGARARRSRRRCCARRRGRSSASTRSGCGARGRERARPCCSRRCAPVPLLWFGPDVLGAGGALGASAAARGTASPQSATYADVPGLEVLRRLRRAAHPPVLLAAVAGAVARRPHRARAGRRRRRLGAARRRHDAGRLRRQPALQRRRGRVRLRARGRRRRARSARRTGAARAAAAAARAARGRRRARVHGRRPARPGRRAGRPRATRREDLNALVRRAPAARRRSARCGAGAHEPADEGDGRLARSTSRSPRLADAAERPAAILQAPPGYAGEPPEPAVPPGFRTSHGRASWRLGQLRDGVPLSKRVGEHVRVALALGQLHRHQPRELGAAAHVELAVDLAQVVLDRLRREEQRGRRPRGSSCPA